MLKRFGDTSVPRTLIGGILVEGVDEARIKQLCASARVATHTAGDSSSTWRGKTGCGGGNVVPGFRRPLGPSCEKSRAS
jgi:hypothetical protein